MTGERSRAAWTTLVALLLPSTLILLFVGRIRQPPGYHNFADQRSWFGVPNFMDVVSNLPFLSVGMWGLVFTIRHGSKPAFAGVWQRLSYAAFFAGVALTFFGSGYYHLHPTNARLLWDRLPMTLGFMGLLSATLAERVDPRLGMMLLPLIVTGASSVAYWHVTESLGRGDLRPYLLVQFGSLLAILGILILFRTHTADTWCLAVALTLYACAKTCESLDADIFRQLHLVSGHTLKHLAAGLGTYFILLMLQRRLPGIAMSNHIEHQSVSFV